MALIVQDGTGLIYLANAYCGRGFFKNYLTVRNRATEWNAASSAVQDAGIISATDYVDRRFGSRFIGQKLNLDMEVAASSILEIRTLPEEDDTITIGEITYTFKDAAAIAYEVTIGADIAAATAALVAAIAGTGGGSGTVAHSQASSTALDAVGSILVQAITAGTLAEPIEVSSSTSRMVWDDAELTGGEDNAEQNREWPRDYAYTTNGVLIQGIPLQLKQAVAEYASRAIIDRLMPDPEVDETGGNRIYAREKVGPLETEYRYSAGISLIFKKYPEADRLITSLLTGIGGVIR